MVRTMALAQVRQGLSGIVEEVATTHERVVVTRHASRVTRHASRVTRHGEPAAILMAVDDYEAMEEAPEILADDELVHAIEASLRTTKRYTLDEIAEHLLRRTSR